MFVVNSKKIIKTLQAIDPHITIFVEARQCRDNHEMGG